MSDKTNHDPEDSDRTCIVNPAGPEPTTADDATLLGDGSNEPESDQPESDKPKDEAAPEDDIAPADETLIDSNLVDINQVDINLVDSNSIDSTLNDRTIIDPAHQVKPDPAAAADQAGSGDATLVAAATMENSAVTEAMPAAAEDEGTVISSTHASISGTAATVDLPNLTATVTAAEPVPALSSSWPEANSTQPGARPERPAGLLPWLGLALVLAVAAGGIVYWILQPDAETAPEPVEISTPAATGSNLSVTQPEPTPAPAPTPAPESTSAPLSPELDAPAALALLQQRADAGLLLPVNQTGKAGEVLQFLQQNYPDSPQLLDARRYLKNAYLQASKQAQSEGNWDAAQDLLDAAFNALEPAAR